MRKTKTLFRSLLLTAVMFAWSAPPALATDWSFLPGKWCYVGIRMSPMHKNVEKEELYNYIFNADGTLLFSDKSSKIPGIGMFAFGSTDRSPKKNGSWTVNGNRIRIVPMFGSFDLTLKAYHREEQYNKEHLPDKRNMMVLTSPLTGPAEMLWLPGDCQTYF